MSDEQIVALLQEAQKGQKTIAALCKEKGVTETTFYTWRKKFAGMQTSEVKRLREMEKENARLKRLLAERDLDEESRGDLPDCEQGLCRAAGLPTGRAGPLQRSVSALPPPGRRSAASAELAPVCSEPAQTPTWVSSGPC